MRYAYYLPYKKYGTEESPGLICGDEQFQVGLKELYHSFGIDKPTIYDGVSRYEVTNPNGTTEIRTVLVIRNLFPKDAEKAELPLVYLLSVEDVERRSSFSQVSPGVGNRSSDL